MPASARLHSILNFYCCRFDFSYNMLYAIHKVDVLSLRRIKMEL